ncbi:MAG: DUF167 domain-containing protein [Candidatus Yanofskybacteria bacterium]|nr:DUF167 domain-containing protein [Candidatus Yanofskybacteria bacterium]
MRINVKAKPNAREEMVEEIQPGEFVVSVKEPPIQGRANTAIVKALQEYFHTPNIRIVSGYTSRNKIIEVGQ